MLRYVGFLWATLIKRAYVYVVSAIYIAMIVLLMAIMGLSAKSGTTSITVYPNSFMAWFSFIFTTIFMSLTVIHVFKKQESEGTELLIAAKPITRPEIVFGKMLVVLSAFMIFQGVTFVSFYVGAQFDSNAAGLQKFNYAFGIALGSVLSGILITSIILLLGSIMGKTGLTVSAMLISVALFIFNMSAVPITGAIAPNISTRDVYVMPSTGKAVPMYSGGKDDYNYDSVVKNEKSSYRYLWYGDIWGQWASLYEIVQGRPERVGDIGNFYNAVHLKTKNFLDQYSSDIFKVNVIINEYDYKTGNDVKGETIVYPKMNVISGNWDNSITNLPTDVKREIDAEIENDKKVTYAIDTNSFVSTIAPYLDKMETLIDKGALPNTRKFIDKNQTDDGNQAETIVRNYIMQSADYDNRFSRNASGDYILYQNFSKTSNKVNGYDSKNVSTWSDDVSKITQDQIASKYYVASAKPFIKKAFTIPFWSIVAISLTSLAAVIYLRRDFK